MVSSKLSAVAAASKHRASPHHHPVAGSTTLATLALASLVATLLMIMVLDQQGVEANAMYNDDLSNKLQMLESRYFKEARPR